MNNQLVWFRTDLRVNDNPALANAIAEGPVVAIYIATPQQWVQHDDALIKLDFWRRNLRQLELELDQLNVELIVFQVDDYKAIPPLFNQLFGDLEIARLHYNREYPVNEQGRDRSVEDVCAEQNVAVSRYDGDVLVSPESVLNQTGSPFKVFTPFANKLRGRIKDHPLLMNTPRAVSVNSSRPRTQDLSLRCTLDDIDWPASREDWSRQWPAGEAEAATRLNEFVKSRISVYKDKRNMPALEQTSALSPYLSSGVISISQCWRMSQRYHDDDGVLCWQNELLWREFYRHIVFHFPTVSMHKPFKAKTSSVPWQHNEEDFNKWCQGNTGFPLVDAGMRQLQRGGWMHNRLRMVTAMFLSKHLLIDWRWGERWFMQNLIDGDFASNNGGWQWSASTGVDAVPYFRIFSPTRQSERFDAEGNYIRTYVPELAHLQGKLIHQPGKDRPGNYPAPMVDSKFARQRALQAFAAS